jgi:hypothetical protein
VAASVSCGLRSAAQELRGQPAEPNELASVPQSSFWTPEGSRPNPGVQVRARRVDSFNAIHLIW